MNYPHLPRTVMLAATGAQLPATSNPVQVPSLGKLDGTSGVVWAVISDVNPATGTDTTAPDGEADFRLEGSFDGETWESLDVVAETDFAAAQDPATSYVVSSVAPYRPAYRVVGLTAVNNDDTNFTIILVK